MMVLVDERLVVTEAIARFIRKYGKGTYRCDNRGRSVGAELAGLDPKTATAEVVDEIIGNGSWTRRTCDECRLDVSAVVRLGQEPAYDSNTAYICIDCLKKAVSMMEKQRSEK